MRVYTTTNVDDLHTIGDTFARLEETGYDGAFTFEAKHDPFVPLAVAAEHTERIELGTAVAIAFARNPMILANVGYDLQVVIRAAASCSASARRSGRTSSTASARRGRARRRACASSSSAIRAIWSTLGDGRAAALRGRVLPPHPDDADVRPGPEPVRATPVFVGGFGPRMVEIAGEVADGLFVHPFNTRRSLLERTLPTLERGLARGAARADVRRDRRATLVVTASTEEELERVRAAARGQLAFYGSTPAYRPTLDCHGWGDLQPELNRLSKQGRWGEMAA